MRVYQCNTIVEPSPAHAPAAGRAVGPRMRAHAAHCHARTGAITSDENTAAISYRVWIYHCALTALVSIWLHLTGARRLLKLHSVTKPGGAGRMSRSMFTPDEPDHMKKPWTCAWMLCPRPMRGLLTSKPGRSPSPARVRPLAPSTSAPQPSEVSRGAGSETPGLDRVGVQAQLIVRTARFLAAMSGICVLGAVTFNVGQPGRSAHLAAPELSSPVPPQGAPESLTARREGKATGRPATAPTARASRLQTRPFYCVCPSRLAICSSRFRWLSWARCRSSLLSGAALLRSTSSSTHAYRALSKRPRRSPGQLLT